MAYAQALVHVNLHEAKYSSDSIQFDIATEIRETGDAVCFEKFEYFYHSLFISFVIILPYLKISLCCLYLSIFLVHLYYFFGAHLKAIVGGRRWWAAAAGGTHLRAARSKQDSCGWSQTVVDSGREQWVTVGSCGWDAREGCSQEWEEKKENIANLIIK